MNEQLEKIKNHIKEHKTIYISGASCFLVGVILGLKFRNQPTQILNTVAPIIHNNNSSNVNLGGYAHKIVQCDQTREIWETVKDAAQALNIDLPRLSRHLNGHIPHINGKTYSIIGVGTST